MVTVDHFVTFQTTCNLTKEILELQERLQNSEIKIEPTPGPDLEELLEDMRMQYEKLAAKNKIEAEQWYNEKVGSVRKLYAFAITIKTFSNISTEAKNKDNA